MSLNIDLTGKVALVTGASLGIGKGCAESLAKAGAKVVLTSRGLVDGDKAAAEITSAGGQAEFIQGDISSLDDIKRLCQEIEARHGKLDILVNNAGFNIFKGIQETTPEDYDALMSLDMRGLFFMTREAVPLMKKAGSACVLNISSVHATATIGNLAAYAAAKGGIVALTRSMCQELGPLGIRVNTVSPGFIDTPLMDRWLAGEPDAQASISRVNSLHPLGRVGRPQDIGDLVVFLGSDHAEFITGANILIDGGLTARLMH